MKYKSRHKPSIAVSNTILPIFPFKFSHGRAINVTHMQCSCLTLPPQKIENPHGNLKSSLGINPLTDNPSNINTSGVSVRRMNGLCVRHRTWSIRNSAESQTPPPRAPLPYPSAARDHSFHQRRTSSAQWTALPEARPRRSDEVGCFIAVGQ